jgi:hypothetical protein
MLSLLAVCLHCLLATCAHSIALLLLLLLAGR